ncbi:MAG TPA: hypothetical protein VGM33_10840 [Baekduia sp.]
MQLGRHLRELWRLRLFVGLGGLLALFVAVFSVARIQLDPPGLTSRNIGLAAASTRVLVDTPKTMVLDLGVDTTNFDSITNRALLVGNVMATVPVRSFIARRAGVPANLLEMSSPVTPAWPRPLASSGKRKTSDILKSLDEYRISIQVNPTVPIIDIYAVAPDTKSAQHLANGTVDGMRDYLQFLAGRQKVAPAQQVHLEQLGPATGGLVDQGVGRKVLVLTFLLAWAAATLAVVFVSRVRRGWRLEAQSERAARPAAVGPPAA